MKSLAILLGVVSTVNIAAQNDSYIGSNKPYVPREPEIRYEAIIPFKDDEVVAEGENLMKKERYQRPNKSIREDRHTRMRYQRLVPN